MPIITLTTDFGWDSGYVAQLKGVILSALPNVQLVDVAHALPPQSIRHAEVMLREVAFGFPLGATHVVVVDPGVGTGRRGIAVQARGHTFVGPDNGVLGFAVMQPGASTVHLDRPAYWREPVSATFHGRDVFAPIAAELAGGIGFTDVGSVITDARPSTLPAWTRVGENVRGQTLVADRFGNLLTNVPASAIDQRGAWSVQVGDVRLAGKSTYADAPVGQALALVGSDGYLEIAVNQGAAIDRFGIDVTVVAQARRAV